MTTSSAIADNTMIGLRHAQTEDRLLGLGCLALRDQAMRQSAQIKQCQRFYAVHCTKLIPKSSFLGAGFDLNEFECR